MVEWPFSLTVRQSVRILVEYFVLSIPTYIGVIALAKPLRYFSNLPSDPGEWEFGLAATLAAMWVISRALRRHDLPWSHLAVWRVQPGGLIAPFLVAIIGVGAVLCGVDNIVEAIAPSPTWIRRIFQDLTDPALQPLASFVAVVVVAPLTEEAICRGLSLRGLLGVHSPSRAILLSSVLFAVMHINPWQMPSALVGGVILGWGYVRTRSLGLCIAGHALHNATWYLSASLPLEIPGVNSTPAPGQTDFVPWWFALSGVILILIGATWFHRSAPAARPFLSARRLDVPALTPSGVTPA